MKMSEIINYVELQDIDQETLFDILDSFRRSETLVKIDQEIMSIMYGDEEHDLDLEKIRAEISRLRATAELDDARRSRVDGSNQRSRDVSKLP